MINNNYVLVVGNVIGNSIFNFFTFTKENNFMFGIIKKIDDCIFTNIRWVYNETILTFKVIDYEVDSSLYFNIGDRDTIYLTFNSEEEMLYFKMKYGGEYYD